MNARAGVSMMAVAAVAAGSAGWAGCAASITIVKPANGSTVARMPTPLEVTEKGAVEFGDVSIDGFNMTRVNGGNWQYVPKATLYCLAPGPHTLNVAARDSKLGTNISESSTFTVSACPLCYSCPTGQVHPATGQCCDGGNCDSYSFANFGPPFYNQPYCLKETAPGTGTWYYELDCIGPQVAFAQGGSAPQMSAVSFSGRAGTLAQIQVPLGWVSGVNGVKVWITEDAAGRPGTVLETIAVNNLRAQPPVASVEAPIHIFSAAKPRFTAGTKYWLVIGPADATTVVRWNKTLNLDDASIPNTTTYLLSTNTADPSGPWAPKSNLVELRPAFEIDVRE